MFLSLSYLFIAFYFSVFLRRIKNTIPASAAAAVEPHNAGLLVSPVFGTSLSFFRKRNRWEDYISKHPCDHEIVLFWLHLSKLS